MGAWIGGQGDPMTAIILKATITVLYEADPKNYGTNDPKQMAELDLENSAPEDILQFGEVSVKIEEVK